MSPLERQLWTRIQRRAGSLSPQLMQEMMKAFRVIAQSYSEQELARLISSGQIERVLETAFNETTLNAAYAPVRDRIRSGVTEGVRYFVKADIPVPKGTIGIAFDSLSPYVVEAIRKLETKVITNLKDDVRETVRQHLLRAIQNSETPKQIAKGLREIIGLSPKQEQIVANYRAELENGSKRALDRALRDKRFDKQVARGNLSAEQIEARVKAYRERLIKFNAETNARTAALDANKLASKLSWDQAVADGIVDGNSLVKTWVGIMDNRERPEHVAMEGETVPYNVFYSNGEDVPGSSTYNCRCISRYHQRRA